MKILRVCEIVFVGILLECSRKAFGNIQVTETTVSPTETWTGRWLPERPQSSPPTDLPSLIYNSSTDNTSSDNSHAADSDRKGSVYSEGHNNRFSSYNATREDTSQTPYADNSTDVIDDGHNIKMGLPSNECDDAVSNLTVDWDGSKLKYLCLRDADEFKPNASVRPLIETHNIPPLYSPMHACMNQTIEYKDVIPTFGTHRPLWPKYGEYQYVPPQRWIHSLEHGAIVMVFHPCANRLEVNKLRKLVTGCLFRHVISTLNTMPPDRPMALVAWGWRMTMSVVDRNSVRSFITQHALQGPEKTSRDGQYTFEMIRSAKVVSNQNDDELCMKLCVSDLFAPPASQ